MDNKLQATKDKRTAKRSWGLLKVLLFAFVIFLALRLLFPWLISALVVGPIILGLPLLVLLIMCIGVFVAIVFTVAGLFLCGLVLIAILLLCVSAFSISWPIITLATLCVILLLISRNKKGLTHEE